LGERATASCKEDHIAEPIVYCQSNNHIKESLELLGREHPVIECKYGEFGKHIGKEPSDRASQLELFG
jgi:hypothetical protein